MSSADEKCKRSRETSLIRDKQSSTSGAADLHTPGDLDMENTTIHPSFRDVHYDNVGYPATYRTQKTGLRLLVDLSKNRDHFKTLTNRLAVAINDAIIAARKGSSLPVNRTDYHNLPSAFASVNASVGATGPRSVRFAYLAPARAELEAVRQNLISYGSEGRDWRAFDPTCPSGIGHLSEGVAASLQNVVRCAPA